ncbi:MAG: carbohydrate ABC transporter substrate-binding protein [Firmicutes bacterium]|nr:carbohydrate ABC transporter substrate-binding protein [Bacillota bacterium]
MRRNRLGLCMLAVVLVLSISSSIVLAQDVQITILNSKGEIQTQLEEIAAYYSSITDGVTVEVIAAGVGQSPFERAVALYASGNAPALLMLDAGDVLLFQDRALALNDEKWVADAIEGSLDMATAADGRILAFPVTVEGYGFIYNRPVLENALGGEFDPTTINTVDALRQLFDTIEASGKGALVISPEDWSLGAHFFALAYSGQSPDFSTINEFMTGLKAGTVSLANNTVANGLLDTFDLMKKYNYDGLDPLASTYDRGTELIGEGEVGFWFMGNWAWPQIVDFDTSGGQFGFLPVPISNDPNGFGNTQIPVGVTKYFILDGEQNSPAQQQAAKDFLNWLVYDAEGQKRFVVDANIIPAFSNITIAPNDPLSASLLDYVREGKTMTFMLNLPPDHWAQVGASMQKYLSNFVNRDAFFKEVEAYWQGL